MPRMLPVLLGGDANVYGMARSFYECYGVRSLAVCRRALPALAHSRLVRVAVQDPAFGQDHVFTATLLGLAAQYPGVPKILISCADDYTALLARHADALRPAVWYTAPWCAVRRACPNRLALRRADTLRRRGRGRVHLLAAGEGLRRSVWFAVRQAGYCRKLPGSSRTPTPTP